MDQIITAVLLSGSGEQMERLFGNIMSGTVMMGLWYGMMPLLFTIGVPAALHCYFDLFSGAIQTYVFCMLTMVYISDKISDED